MVEMCPCCTKKQGRIIMCCYLLLFVIMLTSAWRIGATGFIRDLTGTGGSDWAEI